MISKKVKSNFKENIVLISLLIIIFYDLFWGNIYLASDYLPTSYWIFNFYNNIESYFSSLSWDSLTALGNPIYVNPLGLYYSPLNFPLILLKVVKLSFEQFYLYFQFYLLFIIYLSFHSFKYFLKKSLLFKDLDNELHFIIAFLYTSSTYFTTQLNTIYPIYCALLMPIFLVYLERFFLSKNLKYFFGITLIISSIILSGGIELLVYSSILIIFYIIFLLLKFKRIIFINNFKSFFTKSFLLSINLLLINLIYIYPIKNFEEYTSRKSIPFENYPKYEYRDLLTIFFRDMTSNPLFVWYCGIIFGSLFLTLLIFTKNNFNKLSKNFYLCLFIIIFGMYLSLGSKTDIFYLFYKYYPLINSFNGPYKFNFFLTLISPLISGYILKLVINSESDINFKKRKIIIFSLTSIILLLIFILTNSWGINFSKRISIYLIQTLLVVAVLISIYKFKSSNITKKRFLILIMLIIAIDSKISFDKTTQTTNINPKKLFSSNDLLENEIIKNEYDKYRTLYYKYPSVYHYTNEIWGIPNIFGYNVVDIFSNRYLYYENFDLLGFFNTKFIVSKEKLKLKMLFNYMDYNSDLIYVYENSYYKKLFYENNRGFNLLNEIDCLKYISDELEKNNFENIKVCTEDKKVFEELNLINNSFDNIKSINISSIKDNEIKLIIDSNNNSFVIWNENFHKYWNLEINGIKEKIYKVNGTISGFKIFSGKNEIHLRFKQKDSNLLVYFYFITFLLNVILFLSNKNIFRKFN